MRYNFFLVTARTSQGVYPELPPTPIPARPSAPPCDEGYVGSSDLSSSDSASGSRGVIRPHSGSPFQRNVRLRTVSLQEEEEINLEAISCLLEFAERGICAPTPKPTTTVSTFPAGSDTSPEVMVRRFKT